MHVLCRLYLAHVAGPGCFLLPRRSEQNDWKRRTIRRFNHYFKLQMVESLTSSIIWGDWKSKLTLFTALIVSFVLVSLGLMVLMKSYRRLVWRHTYSLHHWRPAPREAYTLSETTCLPAVVLKKGTFIIVILCFYMKQLK